MSDTDKSDKWVIFELSWHGEKSAEELKELIQDQVERDVEFFIPATTFSKNEDHITVSLMEGYIFARGGHPPSVYFNIEDLPYINQALTKSMSSEQKFLYADQEEIDDLKDQLREETVKEIEEGDKVEIKKGVWENLRGEVIGKADPSELTEEQKEEYEDHIYVEIEDLQSMDQLVTLPKAFLEKI